MIDIRVLGTLEIHGPDGTPVGALTQPKRLALLLYLALAEPSGPKSRDSLMALLWPEADAESARHSLRNAIYALRQALGEAAFVSRGEGYVGLELGVVRCDALEVRRLLAEARWGEAVAGWGGELIPASMYRARRSSRAGSRNSGPVSAGQSPARPGGEWTSWNGVATRGWWRPRSGPGRSIRRMRRAPGDSCGFWTHPSGEPPRYGRIEDLADYLRRECEAAPSAETQALARELKARTEPAASAPPAAPVAPAAARSAFRGVCCLPFSVPRRPRAGDRRPWQGSRADFSSWALSPCSPFDRRE